MKENESVAGAATRIAVRKLRRITEDRHKRAGGVCAGVAYWLGAPVWLIRGLWVFASVFGGFGGGLYVALWICMPKWEETPADYDSVTEN